MKIRVPADDMLQERNKGAAKIQDTMTTRCCRDGKAELHKWCVVPRSGRTIDLKSWSLSEAMALAGLFTHGLIDEKIEISLTNGGCLR